MVTPSNDVSLEERHREEQEKVLELCLPPPPPTCLGKKMLE